MKTVELSSPYTPDDKRYDSMHYRACGKHGLKLSALSLGFWQNFGEHDDFDTAKSIVHKAFDCGITSFDFANNYGPPGGHAEECFARIMASGLNRYRDELIISTKAGHPMWEGPYGRGGSRKHMISSIDQSLKRTGLDYFDIYYNHVYDPETPLEETMSALADIVRSGKALYVGVSNFQPEHTVQADEILNGLGVPCIVHQPCYNMFDRWVEKGLLDVLRERGIGSVVFSPLAQGLLTNKYLEGIPADSRAGRKDKLEFTQENVTEDKLAKVRSLSLIAESRGQSLAQLAIAWLLKNDLVSSVLIGASKPAQVVDCCQSLENYSFSLEEVSKIEAILKNG